jgi:hypothetical protein
MNSTELEKQSCRLAIKLTCLIVRSAAGTEKTKLQRVAKKANDRANRRHEKMMNDFYGSALWTLKR